MIFDRPHDGWFTYLAWGIDPRTRGPFMLASGPRDEHRRRLADLAATLREDGMRTAHALEVGMIVPVDGGPRYDLALLVHGDERLRDTLVERTAALGLPAPELALTARNSGLFGSTEARDGQILLNHFAGKPDPRDAVQAWKDVSEWYVRVLGVDNSTLLEFTPDAPFLIMNYAVLPGRAVPFLAGQLLRPSFHRLVRRRLAAAGITPYPLIARRVAE